MASATETVNITTQTASSSRTPSGVGRAALVAPLDSGATVGAGVINQYFRASDAVEDHGDNSALANGVEAALQNAPRVLAMGIDQVDGSPHNDQFTVQQSGSGDPPPDGEYLGSPPNLSGGTYLPVWEIDSAQASDDSSPTDTVDLAIVYTTQDPRDLVPDADTIIVNTDTGVFNLDASSLSGTFQQVDITWKVYDFGAAIQDKLAQEPHEYIAFAGEPYNERTFGVYKQLLTYANDNKKLIAAALDSGVDPDDIRDASDVPDTSEDPLLTSHDLINGVKDEVGATFLAAHYSGDLTSAWVAYRASLPVMGTTKEQAAPEGVTYDDSYVFSEFGAEQSPSTGTFHDVGVNAVYETLGGVNRVTNDRAATAIGSGFDKFHSNGRGKVFAERRIEQGILNARRTSSDSMPLVEQGLQSIKTLIEGEIGFMQRRNIVGPSRDDYDISVPPMDQISDSNRLDRLIDYVEVSIRLVTQIHLINLDLNVDV